MVIDAKDQVFSFICNDLVNEDIKNNIQLLENYLERRKTNNCEDTFHIIIDNVTRSDIDILLECILHIFQRREIADDIITIHDLNDIDDYDNSVLLLDVDKMSDFQKNWRMNNDNLIRFFKKAFDNHNTLIVASTKPLNRYEVFEDTNIHNIIPAFHIQIEEKPDEIYDRFIHRFQMNHIKYELSYDEFLKIYVSIQYDDYVMHLEMDSYLYEYALSSLEYIKNGVVTIEVYHDLLDNDFLLEDEVEENKEIISIQKLTGLQNVKKEINSLFHYASFIQDMNIDKSNTYLNMFFLGNPGTGKTMVANIIADRLYSMGYLESREIIKVVPNDLIGEYVGQTKKTIRNILDSAKGKLLFIDEAYLIGQTSYRNGRNPYMEEAMVELLKYLEDPTHIVIFAGYREEMKKLYHMNPGLKSRIYKEIVFEDYSVTELYKILSDDLSKKGLSILDKDKKIFIHYIEELKEDKNFGNARSMLQLSQKLIMNHANHYDKNNKLIINQNDLPKDDIHNTRKMGFDAYDGR